MMKFWPRSLDLSKARTIVYHMPDGESITLQLKGIQNVIDLNLEMFELCDTSDIDGTVHVFPRGNA